MPKHSAPGHRERGTKQLHCQLPRDPIIHPRSGTGGRAHTHAYIHAYIAHTHLYTNTDTHTNPEGLKWAQHFDIDLFFLSFPHPPIFSSLTPHPLLGSPLTHHRAILQASAEEEGGEGRRRMVGVYFGAMERREGRNGGRRRGGGAESNNNLTANDGMPGSYPQRAGLHTDQQLPKSI